MQGGSLPMDLFLSDVGRRKPHRVPGTAIASQGHHQRGIGMCAGGFAPGWEFSSASREPHSM